MKISLTVTEKKPAGKEHVLKATNFEKLKTLPLTKEGE